MPNRIRTKFIAIFLAVILPFLAGVTLMVVYNRSALSASIDRIDYLSREMDGFKSIEHSLHEIVMPANDYITTGDRKYLKELESEARKIESALSEVEKLLAAGGAKTASAWAVLQETRADWQKIKGLSLDMFAIEKPVGSKAAVALMEEMDYKWARPAASRLDELHHAQMTEMNEALKAVDDAWVRNWNIIVAGFAVMVSLALFAVIFTLRRILRPIKALHDGSESLMRGDLDHRIELNSKDELQELGAAFNDMAASLDAAVSSWKGQAEKYGSLIEMAPEAIILTDPETQLIVDANPAAERLLGYPREELQGLLAAELYPEAHIAGYMDVFDRASGGDRVSLLDATVLRKDGAPVAVDISASIVRIGDKSFLQGFFRDISDRVELESLKKEYTSELEATVRERTESLNETVINLKKSRDAVLDLLKEVQNSKREWEATFDSILTPLFIHDSEFRVIKCNRAYQQLAGEPFDRIIKRPYYELYPKMDGPFDKCASALEVREADDAEELVVSENDRTYRMRFYPITDSEGGFSYSLHIMEDITESRKAEAEIRLKALLLDCAKDSVFLNDAEGNIFYVNRAAYSTRGYTREELLSMRLQDLDVPEYAGLIETRMAALIEKGEASFESAHYRKDGSVMPVEVHVSAIEHDGKRLMLGVVSDITERRVADYKIRQEIETTKHLLMIADATAQLSNIDSLMAKVVHSVSRIMGADICLSYQWDADAGRFRPVEAAGLDNALTPLFKTGTFSYAAPFVKEAFTMGGIMLEYAPESFVTETESQQPGLLAIIEDLVAVNVIPLSGKQGALGMLISLYVRREASPACEFTGRSRDLMRGISSQVSIALEEARLYRESLNKTMELSRKIETIQVMNEIDRSILSTLNSQEIMDAVVMMTTRVLPADRATIVQLNAEKSAFIYAAGFGQTVLEKDELVHLAHTNMTDVLKTGRSQYVANLKEARNILPLEKSLLESGCMSVLRLPLIVKDEVRGVLSIGASRPSAFTQEDLSVTEKLSSQISVALENSRLLQDVEDLFLSTVRTLSNAIDAKSPWTKGHSERVTGYAIDLARELGFTHEQTRTLEIAGLLHDIGKLGTYEDILEKNGALTPEEFALIKKHPVQGVEILAPIKQLADIAAIVRCHHEYYDGSGYPDGLKGEEIPLMGRVLAVADTVDAMGADRPYRKGRPVEVIVEELKRCSGTQFDPLVVDAFLRTLKVTNVA